mmetsp:Transcript_5510/g.13068  ORF Transcript_5510/g.13068 Transcript_5510/m.13068 type:complete len:107 (-) Transcript_5510:1268-1588(-)
MEGERVSECETACLLSPVPRRYLKDSENPSLNQQAHMEYRGTSRHKADDLLDIHILMQHSANMPTKKERRPISIYLRPWLDSHINTYKRAGTQKQTVHKSKGQQTP